MIEEEKKNLTKTDYNWVKLPSDEKVVIQRNTNNLPKVNKTIKKPEETNEAVEKFKNDIEVKGECLFKSSILGIDEEDRRGIVV